MQKKFLMITQERIKDYVVFLQEQERSEATIQKYARNLTALAVFLDGAPVTKGLLLEWNEE